MKKSIFKILALLAIFSFVAVSCGDDDDSSDSSASGCGYSTEGDVPGIDK